MRLDPLVGVAVGDLPDDVAGVHVVGGDASVRRLDERQSLRADAPRAAARARAERRGSAAASAAAPTASRRLPAARGRRLLGTCGARGRALRRRGRLRGAAPRPPPPPPPMKFMSERSPPGCSAIARHVGHRRHVQHVRFGIPRRALPERRHPVPRESAAWRADRRCRRRSAA